MQYSITITLLELSPKPGMLMKNAPEVLLALLPYFRSMAVSLISWGSIIWYMYMVDGISVSTWWLLVDMTIVFYLLLVHVWSLPLAVTDRKAWCIIGEQLYAGAMYGQADYGSLLLLSRDKMSDFADCQIYPSGAATAHAGPRCSAGWNGTGTGADPGGGGRSVRPPPWKQSAAGHDAMQLQLYVDIFHSFRLRHATSLCQPALKKSARPFAKSYTFIHFYARGCHPP